MTTKEQLAEIRERYVAALSDSDPDAARTVIQDAISNGATTPQIYLSVLTPAQVKIGELWHRGNINSAQEHLATAITMQMLDMQRQAAKPRPPRGLRALVTPVEGEMHFIGARMFADLLIMDGWDVDFFWMATPTKDLLQYLQGRRVDLIGLSTTMPEYLPNAREIAYEIQQLDPPRPKILLGGAAVRDLAEPDQYGADAIVTNVAEAANQARKLVGYSETPPTLQQQLTTIGHNVRTARTRHKLTQKQLAQASGLDRTYISLVEHGKQNLTIAAILKIAEALKTPIKDLIEPTST